MNHSPHSLWKNTPTIAELNQLSKNTIHESLGIEFTQIENDFIEARMPVDRRTHQPFGLLHGGASVVLAESLGSVASTLVTWGEGKTCVGVEVNANHLKSVKAGAVLGRVSAIKIGRTLHVWEIRLHDESSGALVCISRLTVAVSARN